MIKASQDKELAQQKLKSALTLTRKLIAGDWPYEDAVDALKAIEREFESSLKTLEGLGDVDEDILYSHCADARSLVVRYHTFIGVILRSSNIRNAFESYAPIRDIAQALLGEDHRVILGSEWSYTPFVYPIPITSLEKFIFVGLPASEAQNALLTPIAGHELGHAVWRRTDVGNRIKRQVREAIYDRWVAGTARQTDLFPDTFSRDDFEKDFRLRDKWKLTYEWASRQCEELFCDLLGCWLFGDGYIHAFRYLTVPEISPRITENYPTNKMRAEFLVEAGKRFHGHAYPIDQLFPESTFPTSQEVALADEVSESCFEGICREVEDYCATKRVVRPSQRGIRKAHVALEKLQPTDKIKTVADVIIAAWQIRLDLNEWQVNGVDAHRKIGIINDLVFKSFEVDEVRRRERRLR